MEVAWPANHALAIDDALLQRAGEAARRERTTVNALVHECLVGDVQARSRRLEALDRLEALAAGSHSASRAP